MQRQQNTICCYITSTVSESAGLDTAKLYMCYCNSGTCSLRAPATQTAVTHDWHDQEKYTNCLHRRGSCICTLHAPGPKAVQFCICPEQHDAQFDSLAVLWGLVGQVHA